MRARSGTHRSLTGWGQTFCFVARVMTSVNASVRPSCVQCRCSQLWHDENCTGVPSVRVIASEVTRSLLHSGQVPDGLEPAWVRDAGLVAAVDVRCAGTDI